MSSPPSCPLAAPDAKPSASSRVLHLFLIPLGVVTLLVVVAVLFGYLGYVGQTARGHVEQLRHPSRVAWQSAASLSEILRDPSQTEVRRDARLAGDLAAILDEHLATPPANEQHVKLRVFLCRALGEFEVADALPVLLTAASQARDPAELPVRLAAFEAMAVLIGRLGPDVAHPHSDLLGVLLAGADELSVTESDRHDGELIRERSAYALGVLGGPAALDRLAALLDDPYPNVTFNAAIGLARHGDERAVPALARMLETNNPAILSGESEQPAARDLKRTTVLINALRASRQLAAHNPALDLSPLIAAVAQLAESRVETAVQLEAKSVLSELRIAANDR